MRSDHVRRAPAPTTGASRDALFLFAHQDDEFAVLEVLRRALAQGARVRIVYLTTGAPPGRRHEARDRESLAALEAIGVPADVVRFVGAEYDIADGWLHDNLPPAWDALLDECARGGAPESIYAPAWEGGHPDHDSAHALGVLLARHTGALERTRQFPLYHGARLPWIFFKVLSPLEENGPFERVPIPWSRRLQDLRICLAYPSQWRTWVGLYPFVVWHHLSVGAVRLQRVDPSRLAHRPHAGPLLYERRDFADWPAFSARLEAFMQSLPRAG